MLHTYRTPLMAMCLALILPCAAQVMAADSADTAPSEQTPTERQPLPERSQEDAVALERQLPGQEQQTLQAGSDNFLALFKPANSSDPQGAVVIVPGTGESADWPQAIGPLRRKLPDAGWHSLSLTLPDLLSSAAQSRVEPTVARVEQSTPATPADTVTNIEQATAAESDAAETSPAQDTITDLGNEDAQRIFARIDAGIAYAQQQKVRSIILLGHGSGAYWTALYVQQRQPAQVQKLVMVAAQTPAIANQRLDDLIASLKIPTVDVLYAGTPQAAKAALERLQASKRQKDSGYRQIKLNTLPGNQAAEQDQLVRRVRGWVAPADS
ncbi:alpha/beta hydrolase family protein [Pseudomonas sp. R5(2019)]|uniref:alpha/beta hydrolase family protein n=1 Tax=Pseudomonas sp. R5(2019) TaxID=2697566 RepID=UPI0014132A7E|nr:alpha/beta hydrolase family protein [Pseudomonas sp. R5(2019)]NBA97733.1 DUF3530 family protein [Pseudomonas sp. R5(2019)]